MRLLSRLTIIFDRVNDSFAFLAVIILTAIALAVTLEVIQGAIWGRTITGLIELSGLSILYITFLGAAWVLRREGHVRMDILIERLPLRVQVGLNIITSLIGTFACGLITFYGIKVTSFFLETGYTLTILLEPQKWPFIIIIPIGSFMLFIQFVLRTSGFFRDWKT